MKANPPTSSYDVLQTIRVVKIIAGHGGEIIPDGLGNFFMTLDGDEFKHGPFNSTDAVYFYLAGRGSK